DVAESIAVEPRSLARIAARGAVADIYPLSPMQEGMLSRALVSAEGDPYLNQFAFHFAALPDLTALRHAFAAAIARHDILCTAFEWQGLPRPLQVVRPAVDLPWQDLDWRGLTADAAAAELTAWLEADHARGMDLAAAPLLRCATMRLDAGCYVVW